MKTKDQIRVRRRSMKEESGAWPRENPRLKQVKCASSERGRQLRSRPARSGKKARLRGVESGGGGGLVQAEEPLKSA